MRTVGKQEPTCVDLVKYNDRSKVTDFCVRYVFETNNTEDRKTR